MRSFFTLCIVCSLLGACMAPEKGFTIRGTMPLASELIFEQ